MGSFPKVVAYESWGWAVGGVVLLAIPSVRGAFIDTTRTLRKTALAIVFGNEILYIFTKLLMFLAVSLGPVYLVNVLGGTQVLFGSVYGVILTLIAPHIFKEDISGTGLAKKLALGVVTVVGIGLIS